MIVDNDDDNRDDDNRVCDVKKMIAIMVIVIVFV